MEGFCRAEYWADDCFLPEVVPRSFCIFAAICCKMVILAKVPQPVAQLSGFLLCLFRGQSACQEQAPQEHLRIGELVKKAVIPILETTAADKKHLVIVSNDAISGVP